MAYGLAVKRKNALTAILCGGVPAAALAALFWGRPEHWIAGFLAGLLWANAFEYVYHRFLLHLPRSFLGRRHLGHHMAVGTPDEAAHVNLGGSPTWVAALFLINGTPVIILDATLGLGVAPAMLAAFSVYVVFVEEIH
jgi:hypothetical protein